MLLPWGKRRNSELSFMLEPTSVEADQVGLDGHAPRPCLSPVVSRDPSELRPDGVDFGGLMYWVCMTNLCLVPRNASVLPRTLFALGL